MLDIENFDIRMMRLLDLHGDGKPVFNSLPIECANMFEIICIKMYNVDPQILISQMVRLREAFAGDLPKADRRQLLVNAYTDFILFHAETGIIDDETMDRLIQKANTDAVSITLEKSLCEVSEMSF